jgi:4-amino-4-deoxy-L-arabinose transferase-like glycosyltransferase
MSFPTSNLKRIWQAAGRPQYLFLFIAVWVAVVLFSGILIGDLSGYDDAAYAHEARAILQTGDWWTMSLNSSPDFDKPPLFIWLLAISFKIFGISDFAAKIPGVMLGWATIVSVYFLAKELFHDKLAEDPNFQWVPGLAAFCLATTQYFLKNSSHAMTDVPFTFFFTAAIYFYLRGLKNGVFLLAAGIATGLAMLTRSPMGFFPLIIIFIHVVFTRRFKLLITPFFGGMVLLAVTIPAFWYVHEYALFGEIFINRHFANLIAHSAAPETRSAGQHFLWYFEYFFLIIRLYLPWFPFMFYGLYRVAGKLRGKPLSPEILLLTIWFLVILIPFSLAESKVLRYILPVFPVFSILSAYSLTKLCSHRTLAKFSAASVLLLTLAASVIVFFPNFQKRAEDMRTIAPFSDAAAKPEEQVILYTSGKLQWNYQTQLIWYGHHSCLLIKDQKEIENLLSDKKELIIIMDKPSFELYKKQNVSVITVFGESEKFICFRLS